MFRQNFKIVKFFNINELTKFINITINKSQNKRFNITNNRNDAQIILKNHLLQISLNTNDKQLSNIIHKAKFTLLVQKKQYLNSNVFKR